MSIRKYTKSSASGLPKLRKAARLKEKAQIIGDVKFIGEPCGKGHVGIRYASNGACVECNCTKPKRGKKREANAIPRDIAMLTGDKVFNGKPCKNGHNGVRHTDTGKCTMCYPNTDMVEALTTEIERLRKILGDPAFWVDPQDLNMSSESLNIYCTKTSFDGCTVPMYAGVVA